MEILRNRSGSADMVYNPNLSYSDRFCINLCTIHFHYLVAKYRKLTKNIASPKFWPKVKDHPWKSVKTFCDYDLATFGSDYDLFNNYDEIIMKLTSTKISPNRESIFLANWS